MLINRSGPDAGLLRGVFFQADDDGGDAAAAEAKKKTDADAAAKAKSDAEAGELDKLKKERDELLSFKSKAEAEAEKAKREKLDEAERLKLEREDAKKEAVTARKEAVALKYGLPEALAARLQGESREDLEADAKALAELLPKHEAKKANTGTDAGNGDPDAKKTDALDEKKAAHKAALASKDFLTALKLKTEIAKLEAATGK